MYLMCTLYARQNQPLFFLSFLLPGNFARSRKREERVFSVSRDAAQERGGNRSVCSLKNDCCCDLNSALRFNYKHDMMPIVYPWIGLTYLNHGQYIFTRFILLYFTCMIDPDGESELTVSPGVQK